MDDGQAKTSRYRNFGRIAVALYGLMFSALVVISAISDFANQAPLFGTFYWIPLGALIGYGIFALAIPPLRFKAASGIWRYVAYAIPVLMYGATAWDIWRDEETEPVVLAVALVVFMLATMPAVIFNWLLYRKLEADNKR